MKWSDYEQQLLSEDQWSDNISHSSGYTHGSRGYPHTGSESVYGAPSGMMMMPDNMSHGLPIQQLYAHDALR
ncbi:hypothetical protein G6F68_019393 [Rhizopus microsporus]|nr:hypothetical protein G6F68_019393 [Rhizopus microsporus]